MSRKLRVRAQLLNPDTGRFIKAIDERDLSDFLALISPSSDNGKVFIPDLTPAILEVKSHVESLLASKERKDLLISHSLICNLWNKAKMANKESVKEKLNIQVISESEKALNLIHTRIPTLESRYLYPKYNIDEWGYQNEVNEALDSLLSEVQVFIEIVLCNIHASAIIDPSLVEEPSIIGHCQSVYSLLQKWLRHEANVSTNTTTNIVTIRDESFVYQCCIENNIGFNPQALLVFLGIHDSPTDILRGHISSAKNVERYDNRNKKYLVRKMEWRVADNSEMARARKIIKLMQQFIGVLSLFEAIESREVEYTNTPEIFDEIKGLINKDT